MLERLINPDYEMIGYLLIEQNSLDKNLKLLSQLIDERGYEEEKINEIISQIQNLKSTRNFFIHGVWSDVMVKDDIPIIHCANHKWIRKKVSNGTHSTRYKSQTFTLGDLELTIKKADEISNKLKNIWDVLCDFNDFE